MLLTVVCLDMVLGLGIAGVKHGFHCVVSLGFIPVLFNFPFFKTVICSLLLCSYEGSILLAPVI